MSEKLTKITLPGTPFSGLMDWGEKTAPEMIGQARAYAAELRAQADAVGAAADKDFRVAVVRGSAVQHHVKTLQEPPA